MFFAVAVSLYSIWQRKNGINNIPSLHLLTISEFIFISVFFYHTYNLKWLKKFTVFLLIFFIVFFSLNTLFVQDIYTYNTNSRGLEALFVCLYCMLYFYQLLKEKITIPLTQIPEFWVVAGLLIFFSFIQIYSLFFYYLAEEPEMNNALQKILRVASIIYYPLIAMGIWKKSSV
jgi:predicted neutral ceramidase superfamily lipid hydrolase